MKFTTTLLILSISTCALAIPMPPYNNAITLNPRETNSNITSTVTTNSNGQGSTSTTTTNGGSVAGELEFGGAAAAAGDAANTSAAVSSECGPVGCTSAAASAGPVDGASSGSTSSSTISISGKVTWEEHWEHTTFSDGLQDNKLGSPKSEEHSVETSEDEEETSQ